MTGFSVSLPQFKSFIRETDGKKNPSSKEKAQTGNGTNPNIKPDQSQSAPAQVAPDRDQNTRTDPFASSKTQSNSIYYKNYFIPF